MKDFERRIRKISSEVYKSGEKESRKLIKFLEAKKIDDYELECEIVLFRDFEDFFSYGDYLCVYFDEHKRNYLRKCLEAKEGFEEFYESFFTRIKSELGIGIRGSKQSIPRIDFAIYRIRSYYQIITEDLNIGNLEKLNELLFSLEIKALSLRDEIFKSAMQEVFVNRDNGFLNFNLYLETALILRDIDIKIPNSDLKFLDNLDLEILRSDDRIKTFSYESKKFLGCHTCRKFRYVTEMCGWENFNFSDIEGTLSSVVLEKEYIVPLEEKN